MAGLQDPEIFQGVLNSLHAGVYLVDRERKIIFWNEGAERITGYIRHEVLGRPCREDLLAYCDDAGNVLQGSSCPLVGALHEGRPREAHVYLRHKSGHRLPVRVWAAPVRGRDGSIVGASETFDEVTSVIPSDRHQSHLAMYGCLDTASGLPNHGFTLSHLRESLACHVEHHLPFGILLIQVEELQPLKQSRGREAVDAILHVVAQTVKHASLDTFLGRWSEDQFLAIVPDCSRVDLERAAHDIQHIVSRSAIHWWGDSLSVDVVVGRAMVEAGDTLESLLERGQPKQEIEPEAPTNVANDGREN
jgi:PAS domain S-box-containing protein